uniref:DNA-directed RNA polymerase subunit beta'' n=1 Tax=Chaetophoropsis cf. attenuata FACHB-2291 TaxID=2725790 RepID=A0A6H1U6F0_9CHLO|nr:RNA polymerase beta'' subunit [Chaetophoropsis cf. attenuata FACHB-2291]
MNSKYLRRLDVKRKGNNRTAFCSSSFASLVYSKLNKGTLKLQRHVLTFSNGKSVSDPLRTNSQIFLNLAFNKGILKNFVFWCFVNYGQSKTIKILEKLQLIGFSYATKAGISLSIDDLKIPPIKAMLLTDAEKSVEAGLLGYKKAQLTGLERFQRIIETWHKTSESLKDEMIEYFRKTDTLNPVYMMAFSGARGNISQVRQLVSMRGLMSDPQGKILSFPIQSNFREGLTLTEYVISCYGARKGVVDTALRTANAGYLTRRLVDVAQHVIVLNFDCGTKKGFYLTEMTTFNKTLYPLRQRLIGRVLAADIYNFKPSVTKKRIKASRFEEIVARRNQEISEPLAQKIAKLTNKVFIRSPLTCGTPRLVCQLCYGWSLSEGYLVSIGEAVGIIAAQSIGEPGTQLTMRTFHTGGVFSGEMFDQLIAPYDAIINYSAPVPGTLIRTTQGKIAFLIKGEGELSICKSDAYLSQKKSFRLPPYTVLFQRNNEKVLKDQLIAELAFLSSKITQKSETAEFIVKSELEGQIYSGSINIVEKYSNYNDMITQSKDWGTVWLLSGKICQLPLNSAFFALPGDLVDETSVLSEVKWFVPVKTLLDTNSVIKPLKKERYYDFSFNKNKWSYKRNLENLTSLFNVKIEKGSSLTQFERGGLPPAFPRKSKLSFVLQGAKEKLQSSSLPDLKNSLVTFQKKIINRNNPINSERSLLFKLNMKLKSVESSTGKVVLSSLNLVKTSPKFKRFNVKSNLSSSSSEPNTFPVYPAQKIQQRDQSKSEHFFSIKNKINISLPVLLLNVDNISYKNFGYFFSFFQEKLSGLVEENNFCFLGDFSSQKPSLKKWFRVCNQFMPGEKNPQEKLLVSKISFLDSSTDLFFVPKLLEQRTNFWQNTYGPNETAKEEEQYLFSSSTPTFNIKYQNRRSKDLFHWFPKRYLSSKGGICIYSFNYDTLTHYSNLLNNLKHFNGVCLEKSFDFINPSFTLATKNLRFFHPMKSGGKKKRNFVPFLLPLLATRNDFRSGTSRKWEKKAELFGTKIGTIGVKQTQSHDRSQQKCWEQKCLDQKVLPAKNLNSLKSKVLARILWVNQHCSTTKIYTVKIVNKIRSKRFGFSEAHVKRKEAKSSSIIRLTGTGLLKGSGTIEKLGEIKTKLSPSFKTKNSACKFLSEKNVFFSINKKNNFQFQVNSSKKRKSLDPKMGSAAAKKIGDTDKGTFLSPKELNNPGITRTSQFGFSLQSLDNNIFIYKMKNLVSSIFLHKKMLFPGQKLVDDVSFDSSLVYVQCFPERYLHENKKCQMRAKIEVGASSQNKIIFSPVASAANCCSAHARLPNGREHCNNLQKKVNVPNEKINFCVKKLILNKSRRFKTITSSTSNVLFQAQQPSNFILLIRKIREYPVYQQNYYKKILYQSQKNSSFNFKSKVCNKIDKSNYQNQLLNKQYPSLRLLEKFSKLDLVLDMSYKGLKNSRIRNFTNNLINFNFYRKLELLKKFQFGYFPLKQLQFVENRAALFLLNSENANFTRSLEKSKLPFNFSNSFYKDGSPFIFSFFYRNSRKKTGSFNFFDRNSFLTSSHIGFVTKSSIQLLTCKLSAGQIISLKPKKKKLFKYNSFQESTLKATLKANVKSLILGISRSYRKVSKSIQLRVFNEQTRKNSYSLEILHNYCDQTLLTLIHYQNNIFKHWKIEKRGVEKSYAFKTQIDCWLKKSTKKSRFFLWNKRLSMTISTFSKNNFTNFVKDKVSKGSHTPLFSENNQTVFSPIQKGITQENNFTEDLRNFTNLSNLEKAFALSEGPPVNNYSWISSSNGNGTGPEQKSTQPFFEETNFPISLNRPSQNQNDFATNLGKQGKRRDQNDNVKRIFSPPSYFPPRTQIEDSKSLTNKKTEYYKNHFLNCFAFFKFLDKKMQNNLKSEKSNNNDDDWTKFSKNGDGGFSKTKLANVNLESIENHFLKIQLIAQIKNRPFLNKEKNFTKYLGKLASKRDKAPFPRKEGNLRLHKSERLDKQGQLVLSSTFNHVFEEYLPRKKRTTVYSFDNLKLSTNKMSQVSWESNCYFNYDQKAHFPYFFKPSLVNSYFVKRSGSINTKNLTMIESNEFYQPDLNQNKLNKRVQFLGLQYPENGLYSKYQHFDFGPSFLNKTRTFKNYDLFSQFLSIFHKSSGFKNKKNLKIKNFTLKNLTEFVFPSNHDFLLLSIFFQQPCLYAFFSSQVAFGHNELMLENPYLKLSKKGLKTQMAFNSVFYSERAQGNAPSELVLTSYLSPFKGEILLHENFYWSQNTQRNRYLFLTKTDQISFYSANYLTEKKKFENISKTQSKFRVKSVLLGKSTFSKLDNKNLGFFLEEQFPNKLFYGQKKAIGQFINQGDCLKLNSENSIISSESGILIHYNKFKITLRKAQSFFLSPNCIFHYAHGDLVEKNKSILSLPYQQLKTGDIVQGIPKVEQLLEARSTFKGKEEEDNLHTLLIYVFELYKKKFSLKLSVRKTFAFIQLILVNSVQRIYRSQGVNISDKHLEVIVKQMTNKVQITSRGDSSFFRGEYVDLYIVETWNSLHPKLKKICYKPILLGISRSSLEVNSFLSAASFQHTKKVLSRSAFKTNIDFLNGLKENVIIGNLISAGTGILTTNPIKQ